ncbi:amidohydrolase [Azotosporobacter soli]|uniref:amidohydrolase n=1 Tax=Azotosporobacter soli TaxID=3055040 RepID=UPI0031FEF333
MDHATLLLKDCEFLTAEGTVQQGDIGIQADRLLFVGTPPADWQADRTLDCSDKLVIPGLVNTHSHAAMSLFRGYADDMALMDWLETKIWPAEGKMDAEDVYWGSMLAIAEMLRSGTTTFSDMYIHMDQVAHAVQASGIRAVLARGMSSLPNGDRGLREAEELFTTYHGTADGRLSVMLGPHAPYTCPPDYLKKVLALAEKLDAEIHIHLAETEWEIGECQKEYGKTPFALMKDAGLFERGVLAAHCVHMTDADIEILQQYNVRVAHNPASNMKLASGIAPVPKLLDAGICVALGTDGAASNNNLDLIEEMRLAALLHKVHGNNPQAIPAKQAFSMATQNGATALGLQASIGVIAPGFKADLAILSLREPHLYPRFDRLSLLTYAASGRDVDSLIVNGSLLMENRKLTTIDEEQLFYEVQKRATRLTS